jgi:hypothetical protein
MVQLTTFLRDSNAGSQSYLRINTILLD